MRALTYLIAGLVLLLAGMGVRWAVEHYDPDAVPPPRVDAQLGFDSTGYLVNEALERYRALPAEERRAVTRALRDAIVDGDTWMAHINRQPLDMLCLGERHQDTVRQFLSRDLLGKLDMDVLMLEAGSDTMLRIRQARSAGDGPQTLLGAGIDDILDAVAARDPAPAVIPVDESEVQRRARLRLARADLSRRAREDTIVANLRRRWQPGVRHVILFGALHCRDLPGWFYHRLPREDPRISVERVANVVLLPRSHEPSAQMLFALLEAMGWGETVLAVPDTSRFPGQVEAWLPPVSDAFATYAGAIFFDDRRGRPGTDRK